jgi:hypothetical protein
MIRMWGFSTLTQNHPRTPQCPAQALLGLGRRLHLPSYSSSNSGALVIMKVIKGVLEVDVDMAKSQKLV